MSGFYFRTHVILFIIPIVLGDATIQEGVGDGVIDDVVDMGENAAKGLYHVGSAIWDGAEYAWDNWLEENSLSIAGSDPTNEESVSDADEEVGGFWDEMEYAAEDVFDFGVDVVKTGADVLYDAADIILEENSVADSDYHLGTSGATTCMSGYGPITTPEGCKTASKALNKKFGGKGKGKNPYRLPYCWIGSKHSSVNFNPNGDSGDQKTPARLVCKKLESAVTKKGTKTLKSKVGKANLPSAPEETVANTEKISGSVSQSISRNTTLNSALLVLALFGLASVLYSSYGLFLKVSDYIKVPEEQALRV